MGETPSSDFPTTAGAFDRTRAGQIDMFVTKLNPTGSALVYSTFLGGAQVDNGQAVTVDSAGNAYAIGASSSADFPTTAGAFDRTANGGFDGTVTKLNPAGSALVYSTYLGGQDFDGGADVAVDGSGNAYVAGATASANFPTTPGAFDTTPRRQRRLRHEAQPGWLGAGLLDGDRRQRERLAGRHRARPGRQRLARRGHHVRGLPGLRRTLPTRRSTGPATP